MDTPTKPLRHSVYLGSEHRARRAERLAEHLGLNISDLFRRLLDQACEQAGIAEPGEQVSFRFDLPPSGRPGAGGW